MTTVIFQGSSAEVSRKLMTDKAANDLLRSIQSTNTYVVQGTSLQYTDSYTVVPKTCEDYTELYILGEEVNYND